MLCVALVALMKQHEKPCRECPWRREGAPGWLGNHTPENFVAMSEAEQRMPCHTAVDYDAPDWEEQAAKAPQCAGRAIHLGNRCKRPRDKRILVLPADHEAVFSTAAEFIAYHEAPELTYRDRKRTVSKLRGK